METGTPVNMNWPASENGEIVYPAQWRVITNPDIKHANVMLGEAQNGFYPGFKTAKMIDFGLCVDDERYYEPDNKYIHGVGTPGLWPPVSFCTIQH